MFMGHQPVMFGMWKSAEHVARFLLWSIGMKVMYAAYL